MLKIFLPYRWHSISKLPLHSIFYRVLFLIIPTPGIVKGSYPCKMLAFWVWWIFVGFLPSLIGLAKFYWHHFLFAFGQTPMLDVRNLPQLGFKSIFLTSILPKMNFSALRCLILKIKISIKNTVPLFIRLVFVMTNFVPPNFELFNPSQYIYDSV